jgi:hypothetical protein
MKGPRKIVSLLLAAVLVCSSAAIGASAQSNSALDWNQFRGNTLSAAVTDAKMPISPESVEEKWAMKYGSGWGATPGTPVIVNGYVYTLISGLKTINKISTETGEIVASAPCEGGSQFFSQIASGDGMIFVPRALNGGAVIYAYDADTLEQLWVSDILGNAEDSLQPLSAITYHNGYIYMGASNGKADKGVFVCLSTADEEPGTPDEVKKPVWSYTPETGNKGYYWSNGTIVNDAIVFGGENGVLVSHSLVTDEVYDTIALEWQPKEGIRSTVAYDATTGRVFVSTKTGMLHSVKVNYDNTFEDTTMLSRQLDKDITSSPTVYNGRVYQGGGGIESEAGFTVLDAETLETIYTIPGLLTQSSPILTTAYATPENNFTVYLYVTRYPGYGRGGYDENSSCTYVIKDCVGQTEPSYQELITPSQLQYCTQSLAVNRDGSFCYYNDSGYLFYFGHKNAADGLYTAADVERAINLLPAPEDAELTDTFTAQRIQERYDALTKDEQAKVSNLSVLSAFQSALASLRDDEVQLPMLIEKINGLPDTVTLHDQTAVDQLFRRYRTLSVDNQGKVSNFARLQLAEQQLRALKEKAVVKRLNDMISALPALDQTATKDRSAFAQVYALLSNQSSSVQEQITGLDTVENGLNRIKEIEADIALIKDSLYTLPYPLEATLEDLPAFQNIVEKYEGLQPSDRAQINDYYYEDIARTYDILKGLEAKTLVADVFDYMAYYEEDYTYHGVTPEGNKYDIIFSQADIVDPTLSFHAALSLHSDNEADIQKLADGALILNFAHRSALPGKLTLTLETPLADGTYNLYQYCAEKATADLMQEVNVSDGFLTLTLDQTGEFFLAKELKVDDNSSSSAGEDSQPDTSSSASSSTDISTDTSTDLPSSNGSVGTGDPLNFWFYGIVSLICLSAAGMMLILRKKAR